MWETLSEYLNQNMGLWDVFVWYAVGYFIFLLAAFSAQGKLTGEDWVIPFIWLGLISLLFVFSYFGSDGQRRTYFYIFAFFVPILMWTTYLMASPVKKRPRKLTESPITPIPTKEKNFSEKVSDLQKRLNNIKED